MSVSAAWFEEQVEKNNFFYLLAALLSFLAGAPTLAIFTSSPLVPLLYSVPLIVGVWSLLGVGHWFAVGVALTIAGSLAAIVNLMFAVPFATFILEVIYFVFLVVVGVIALRQVLFARVIDANRLVGAVCVYLILGMIFALLCYWLAALRPGSFLVVPAADTPQIWDFVYYSFDTITTLGDRNITPVMPLARTLAYLEAATGHFYSAIVVGTLVGSYLAEHPKR